MTDDVTKVLERIAWMEWDEKVAVFRGVVGYLGHDFVARDLQLQPPPAPPVDSAHYWEERYRAG